MGRVCSILGFECKADLDFLHHEPGHTSQSRAKAQVHHPIFCKPHQAWLLFSSHTHFAMFFAVKQPLYSWGQNLCAQTARPDPEALRKSQAGLTKTEAFIKAAERVGLK